MSFLVVKSQIRPLLRVAVGIVTVNLTNTDMGDLRTEFPHGLHPGIPQLDHAILDAKGPLSTHRGISLILNAKRFAFADAGRERLAAASADGVIDARQANIFDWGIPIRKIDGSIAGLFSGTMAGAAAKAAIARIVGIVGQRSSVALGQEHSQR